MYALIDWNLTVFGWIFSAVIVIINSISKLIREGCTKALLYYFENYKKKS
jgi:hypothetical protein